MLLVVILLAASGAARAQQPCNGLIETNLTADSVAATVVQAVPPQSIGAYVAFPDDGKVVVRGNTVYFVTQAKSFTIKFQALTSKTDAAAPTFTFTWP